MSLDKFLSIAFAGIMLSGSSVCVASELPASVVEFQASVLEVLPGASDYRQAGDHCYDVLDKSGSVLGKLMLDATAKSDLAIGFGGPVPVAVILGKDGKIGGVVLGKNEETPGFLRRVKKAGFLQRWNGLALTDALTHKVDTVTGATRSSTAIRSGVNAIARAAAVKAGMKVAPAEDIDVKALRARLKKLERGIAFCDQFAEQWKTKVADEVEARFVYAVEGSEAGDKVAKARNVRIFKHGKKVVGEKLQALVDAYKKDPSAANKEAVKELIRKDIAYLQKAMLEHKAELVKSKAAIEAQLKKAAKPAKSCMMRFHSPEAKKLEARIQALAVACKKAPNAAHEKALRAALKEQLDSGIKAMSGAIARKEAELKKLKDSYDRIAANPDKVIEKRFRKLTGKCNGKCKHCKKHKMN